MPGLSEAPTFLETQQPDNHFGLSYPHISHLPTPTDGFCITSPHLFILTATPLGQGSIHIPLNESNSTVGCSKPPMI